VDIKIDLNPLDIEQAVVTAVIDSSLGEAIGEIVQREIDELSQSRSRGVLAQAIQQEVRKIVLCVLRDEYAEKIRDAVRSLLSDAVVDRVSLAAFDAFFDKLQT